MGCFVVRKGVCVQGPPISALAWGVKQIDWQASGSQFQTLWSPFTHAQRGEPAEDLFSAGREVEEMKDTEASQSRKRVEREKVVVEMDL